MRDWVGAMKKKGAKLIISYASKKIKSECEDANLFAKRCGEPVFSSFQKKVKLLNSREVINIQFANRVYRGLNFEKLRSYKAPAGSFRLNKNWRVNFIYEGTRFELAPKIIITKIHNHKY